MAFDSPSDANATRNSLFERMRTAAHGDESAWREFHDRYAPIIFGFARRMGANDADAADTVQEVLTGFFSALPRFNYDPTRGRFRGYLKACAWRALSSRVAPRSIVGMQHPRSDQAQSAPSAVEEAWNDEWELNLLEQALDRVRSRYQSRADSARTFQIFELVSVLDRPPAEVSRELAVSLDAVYQARSRVGRAVREEYELLAEGGLQAAGTSRIQSF